MPQSDGHNRLQRMAFEYRGVIHTMAVNPQEFTQDEPSRSTVTQTKGGAWIDDFGGGLKVIFIKGRSGFQNGSSIENFKTIRQMVRNYYDNTTPGQEVKNELLFHNFTDDESWVVHTDPSGFKLLRSKANPLEFMYEIRLICLRPAQIPSFDQANEKQSGVGNPLGPSIPKSESVPQTVNTATYSYAMPFLLSSLAVNDKNQVPSTVASFVNEIRFLSNGQVIITADVGNTQNAKASRMMAVAASANVEPTMDLRLSNLAMDYINTLTAVGSKAVTTTGVPKDTLLYDAIYLDKSDLSNNIVGVLRIVILETVAITVSLASNPSDFSRRISEADVSRVIQNIRWLTEELFKNNANMDLIEQLRWLERSMAYVKVSSSLFNTNVKQALDGIKSAQGGAK